MLTIRTNEPSLPRWAWRPAALAARRESGLRSYAVAPASRSGWLEGRSSSARGPPVV